MSLSSRTACRTARRPRRLFEVRRGEGATSRRANRGSDAKQNGEVMRSVFIALLLGSIIVFAACGLTTFPDEHPLKLTFINTSDSLLCFNTSGTGVDFCNKVNPRGISFWRPGCGSGKGAVRNPITVVLTVKQGDRRVVLTEKEGERRIYQRTATCKEWEDSGATFIIKQRGDEFIVTDSLPDAPPSP